MVKITKLEVRIHVVSSAYKASANVGLITSSSSGHADANTSQVKSVSSNSDSAIHSLPRAIAILVMALLAHVILANNSNYATVGSLSMHPGSWKSMTVINTG